MYKKEKNKKLTKEKLEQLKKKTKGITLIALVVTIIVLLILAGVAINLSIGQNGIFSRAIVAKDEYSKATSKEKISLAMQALLIEKKGNGQNEKISAEELTNQLNEEGLSGFSVSGNSNLIVKLKNNESFVVKQTGEVLDNSLNAVLKQGDYINYNSDSLSGGENWRVFYINNGNVSIVSTNPTEIVQATNNGVTEESESLTKQFGKFLSQKRTEKVSVNIGRDKKYGDEIVAKDLNYYSRDLAKNYSLTITIEDIKKAIGISYNIGESVTYEDLKKNDVNNLFPLIEDCYLLGTYYGNLNQNKNSLYMMASKNGGLGACWLMQSAFSVGTKIRPIVELKDNLEIVDGDGSIENPYTLKVK